VISSGPLPVRGCARSRSIGRRGRAVGRR
jgi:hypothetical protein